MTVTSFTPVASTIGGALIGLSAVMRGYVRRHVARARIGRLSSLSRMATPADRLET
jgi:hypothetical protein